MLDIHKISKIGFGGYRIQDGNGDHEKSLYYAIKNGCTLIETASNYRNGDSERLIGRMAKSINKEIFIISKTGYVHRKEQDEIINYFERKSLTNSLHKIRDDFYYSIDPDYLERQLNKSLENLKRSNIDGYLLHNPEYLLQGTKAKSVEEFYESIKNAFLFLEEKVKLGVIRYYGISSNALVSTDDNYSLNLDTVLKIANEVSSSHHFKIIEFPFNLLEQNALKKKGNGLSLIERAHQENIICLSNRPFNAQGNDGPVRLVTYDNEITSINDDNNKSYGRLKHDIMESLDSIGFDGVISDFEVIQYLDKNWMNFKSPEQRDKVVNGHLRPLLNQLFDILPESYFDFISSLELFLKQNITNRSREIKKMSPDLEKYSNSKDLTQILCEYYIDSGIDTILVGMRKQKYVEQLQYLF